MHVREQTGINIYSLSLPSSLLLSLSFSSFLSSPCLSYSRDQLVQEVTALAQERDSLAKQLDSSTEAFETQIRSTRQDCEAPCKACVYHDLTHDYSIERSKVHDKSIAGISLKQLCVMHLSVICPVA